MKTLDQTQQHYLSIKLNDELFAINVNKVLEVLQNQQTTKIPNVPDFIKGVINFRGEIVPVIEARQKFKMPQREDNQKYVIIVLDLEVNDKKILLGVIVDGVKDVLELSDDIIKDVPEMGTNYNIEFIKGMVKLDKGFLMLLNVDRVFSSEEINIIDNTQLTN
jgi:purine-binding chemotaxis protein CheW